MEPADIVQLLKERFSAEVVAVNEFCGQTSVIVKRDRIVEMLTLLRSKEYAFNHLQDLCGVDYLGKKAVRYEVVYQLYSIENRCAIRIRAEVPESDPSIDSVSSLWPGASWHERECYDLFGIGFKGHPDLRRVLLPEDWEGHPLRKDYPLGSNLGDREWKGLEEVVAVTEKNRQYETR